MKVRHFAFLYNNRLAKCNILSIFREAWNSKNLFYYYKKTCRLQNTQIYCIYLISTICYYYSCKLLIQSIFVCILDRECIAHTKQMTVVDANSGLTSIAFLVAWWNKWFAILVQSFDWFVHFIVETYMLSVGFIACIYSL